MVGKRFFYTFYRSLFEPSHTRAPCIRSLYFNFKTIDDSIYSLLVNIEKYYFQFPIYQCWVINFLWRLKLKFEFDKHQGKKSFMKKMMHFHYFMHFKERVIEPTSKSTEQWNHMNTHRDPSFSRWQPQQHLQWCFKIAKWNEYLGFHQFNVNMCICNLIISFDHFCWLASWLADCSCTLP